MGRFSVCFGGSWLSPILCEFDVGGVTQSDAMWLVQYTSKAQRALQGDDYVQRDAAHALWVKIAKTAYSGPRLLTQLGTRRGHVTI